MAVAEERAPVRLVAGLGNPGAEYQWTRHNVGFLVLDRLAKRLGGSWDMSSKWGAATSKIGPLILVKPMTYMNNSGEPLVAVADFYKIPPARDSGGGGRHGAAVRQAAHAARGGHRRT